MSVAIVNGITKEFLESLRRPEEELAPPVTIDELSEYCKAAFDLYGSAIKKHLDELGRQKVKSKNF